MKPRRISCVIQLETRRMTGPAFLRAGLAGVGLYVTLLMWSLDQERDGFVPAVIAERFLRDPDTSRRKVLARLIESGLLVREGADYRIADYADCASTLAEIDAVRERQAARAKAHALRSKIIERDGLVCRICGREVDPADVHVDHAIPLARGGPSTPENLRVTHRRCNLLKGAS